MAGKTGQKKRFRADQEKGLNCAQALAAGISVAQVARRCTMKGNLIFRWVKNPRFSPVTGQTPDAPGGGGVFLPVQISGFAIDQRVGDTAVRTAGSVSALLLAHRVSGALAHTRYLRHPGFLSRPLVGAPRPPGRPGKMTPSHRNVRPSGIRPSMRRFAAHVSPGLQVDARAYPGVALRARYRDLPSRPQPLFRGRPDMKRPGLCGSASEHGC